MSSKNRKLDTNSFIYGLTLLFAIHRGRSCASKLGYFRPNSWILSVVSALSLAIITCSTLTISLSQAQPQLGMKLQKVGLSPLFGAAQQGDWQSVDYLLKSGVNPNVKFSEDAVSYTHLTLPTIYSV